MSLANPFTVSPPARVDVTSGWRSALTLSDGTLIARAMVLWPLADDGQVRDAGRVEARVSVDGGAWRSLPATPGGVVGAYVTPAAVGSAIVAQARFVKPNGRASAWTQSAPHVVVDPILSQRTASYDSASDGWRGSMSGAATVDTPERSVAQRDSWRDGFSGEAAGAQAVPQYRVESQQLADSLRGWTGAGQGCTTQQM